MSGEGEVKGTNTASLPQRPGRLSDGLGSRWSFPRFVWDLVWEALLLKASETLKATNKI